MRIFSGTTLMCKLPPQGTIFTKYFYSHQIRRGGARNCRAACLPSECLSKPQSVSYNKAQFHFSPRPWIHHLWCCVQGCWHGTGQANCPYSTCATPPSQAAPKSLEEYPVSPAAQARAFVEVTSKDAPLAATHLLGVTNHSNDSNESSNLCF